MLRSTALRSPRERITAGSVLVSLILSVALAAPGIDRAVAAPETEPPMAELPVDRRALSTLLRDSFHHNRFPDHLVVPISGHQVRARVDYTLDVDLHEMLADLYRRYGPDYACFVAVAPETGAVLTLTSFIKAREDWGNLALRSVYPAASVFKIVTAAAALDLGQANPETVIAFNGKSTTLYKNQVLRHKNNKWTRYPTLREAFAKSINPVFGRLGVYTVGGEHVWEYANRFGFNQPLTSDLGIAASEVALSPADQWTVAEASSGFTRNITLSPVHAAAMAASVVNGGRLMQPFVVDALRDGKGEPLYDSHPDLLSQPIGGPTAAKLRKLMQQTVKTGSARSSFKQYHRRGPLKHVEVGGKTGSLTGLSPKGRHDWFVGYGVAEDGREVAFASLIINKDKWYVRSAYVARKFLEHYFSTPAGTEVSAK